MRENPKPLAFIVFDLETTGQNPVKNSIISMSFIMKSENETSKYTDSFSCNLKNRSNTVMSDSSRLFWNKHKTQFRNTQKNTLYPSFVLHKLVAKIKNWNRRFELYWLTNPASFDWTFLYYYLNLYLPKHQTTIIINSTRCIDLSVILRTKSLISKIPFKVIKNMYTVGISDSTNEHNAFYDALMNVYVVNGIINEIGLGFKLLRVL